MKFKIKKTSVRDYHQKYPKRKVDLARKFAKKVYKEFGDFAVALTLFGSVARGKKSDDIDILIIIDDVHMQLSRELVETYRIILAKIVSKLGPKKFHVQTMKWTSFWEYVRAGDPVIINILRDSISLIDIGFFDAVQTLLFQGRIRPSKESIWTYFKMAPVSISRSERHIDLAVLDLYWASIDAAHAALMSLGEIPPSPSHVHEYIQKKMVDPGHVPKKYAEFMKHIYKIAKQITHRRKANLEGEYYDHLRVKTDQFVKTMRKFIKK